MNIRQLANIKIKYQRLCYTQILRLFVLCTIALFLFGCGIDRNIKKGEKFLAIGEYYDAATQFKTAYQRTPAKDRTQRGQLARQWHYATTKLACPKGL